MTESLIVVGRAGCIADEGRFSSHLSGVHYVLYLWSYIFHSPTRKKALEILRNSLYFLVPRSSGELNVERPILFIEVINTFNLSKYHPLDDARWMAGMWR